MKMCRRELIFDPARGQIMQIYSTDLIHEGWPDATKFDQKSKVHST